MNNKDAKEAIEDAIKAYEDLIQKMTDMIKSLRMRLVAIDTIENT